MRSFALGTLALTTAVVGCGQQPSTRPAAPPPPQVDVARPIVKELVEWDEYLGRLAAAESVEVRARVGGFVDSIHFTDGQLVARGDLLFVIDPRPYRAALAAADAEVRRLDARLALATNDAARSERLLRTRAISAEEHDTRAKAVDEAQAALEGARAQREQARLNVEFTEVRAPMAGRASRHLVSVGNLISGGTSQGTLLTTILAVDEVHAYFDVDEQAFLRYSRLAMSGERQSPRDAPTVVDDAIVVVENVERHLARGLSPRDASRLAMDEVGGPVIAIALVLTAVFVPTALLTGFSGGFYRQFALTIAVATLLSAFNSLTLSPALSALLLQPHGARKDWFARLWDALFGWFFRGFNRAFDAVAARYGRVVARLVRLSAVVLVLYVGLLLLTGALFGRVPGGFVPAADQGYVIVAVQGPDGASLERTDASARQVSELLRETPGVEHTLVLSGFSVVSQTNASNAATVFGVLAPFEERVAKGLVLPRILGDAQARLLGLDDALALVIPPPTVQGMGTVGGFTFQVQDRAGQGSAALAQATDDLVRAANLDPALSRVFTLFRASSPQLRAEIDRTKAEMLGVPAERVLDALQVHLGSSYVNDFTLHGRSFRVTAQALASQRLEPDDIGRLRARSDSGAMVPLGSLTTLRETAGPSVVTRYGMFPAAAVNGAPTPGTSTGQVMEAMERLAASELPSGFGFEWTGIYDEQRRAGNTSLFVFPLAVVFVFLTLAALYESWSLPLAILLIVPMTLLSAIAGVWLRGMDNGVLTQIGFIVLVGLAAKNAILIVEFAKAQEDAGAGRHEAVVEASRLRLRPILMTSLAFILGVVPLVVATGPGAELRQALGTAVFFGMLGVTFFGLLFTPAFYVLIRGLSGAGPASAAQQGVTS